MKHLVIFILASLSANANCQNKIIGSWEGKINVGVTLRIGLNFIKDNSGNITATMDSPDQAAYGIPTDRTYATDDSVFTEIKSMQVTFSGKRTDEQTIKGIFRQGRDIPLELKRIQKKGVTKRSQSPVPPFSYNSEDVTYYNADKSISFGATLTYPKPEPGVDYVQAPKFPTILLISGSGPQNRNEEIMGHKPFAVIADHLTKNGFQVLRVDDRGVAKTTGDFNTATSKDFADDVEAGINYLRSLRQTEITKIGLLGHSEGGMVAPMVAANRNDISFMVLMAAPGIPVSELMTEQNIAILKSSGMPDSIVQAYGKLYKEITMSIVKSKDSTQAISNGKKVMDKWLTLYGPRFAMPLGLLTANAQDKYINDLSSQLSTPWYKFFLTHDPEPALKKTKSKVLAINGDKDIQVLSASNLSGIEKALQKSKSPAFTVLSVPGKNHLFQSCTTCTVSEYGQLDETISPSVLDLITNWLDKHVK